MGIAAYLFGQPSSPRLRSHPTAMAIHAYYEKEDNADDILFLSLAAQRLAITSHAIDNEMGD